ncbi:MAG: hypothetical protein ACOYJY_08085 [Acutalibacteraceae bacterium]|jgi:uroporphyrinogen decarboxylase
MAEMSKKERTVAAFEGRQVDHVPVCMWQHVPWDYVADDDAFAAYQARAFHATGVDFMKLSADGYFGWPSPLLETIDSADDLLKLETLGGEHPYVKGQIARTVLASAMLMAAAKTRFPFTIVPAAVSAGS